jgi:DNA repair protein RadD
MQPRYYQEDAIQSVFNYFERGNTGNPLVCMPTGTGKSGVIAWFIQRVLGHWPDQRIIVLTHVKELIQNNADTLKRIWPYAPVGIYSSGLKQKNTGASVIFGGVQSVVSNVAAFGHRDLLLIDEAHLLGPSAESSYGKVIEGLKAINPHLKVIGLTATPYRTGTGPLTEAGLFTDVCYDITGFRAFLKLIDEGYLVEPVSKRTVAKIDLSNVGISNGDYNIGQLEDAMDTQDLNYQVCKEMIQYGADRHSWLVFASGVKHAEHIAQLLRSFGISTVAVYSKMGDGRDKAISDFKSGRLRCIVNNNVLTTGFDHPATDFIGMLRPTMSTGLWVQMLGRGTRPSAETGKTNCLVLDFAGNTLRLGPINDPLIPKKRGSREKGVPPIKICELCGTYNHSNARVCVFCKEEFPKTDSKLDVVASSADLIRRDSEQNPAPVLEWFDVKRVVYKKYVPNGKPPLLKVTYICDKSIMPFSEIVCLEHPKAKGLATKWWKARLGSQVPPATVDEALPWCSMLAVPTKIQVWINKKYPEVVNVQGLRSATQ